MTRSRYDFLENWGYGNGSRYGFGDGFGNGSSSGDGTGYGDGSVYGDGYGSGSGNGYGSGAGNKIEDKDMFSYFRSNQ